MNPVSGCQLQGWEEECDGSGGVKREASFLQGATVGSSSGGAEKVLTAVLTALCRSWAAHPGPCYASENGWALGLRLRAGAAPPRRWELAAAGHSGGPRS